MDQVVISLSNALVPGVGPVLVTLNVVRKLFIKMNESKTLCEYLQKRLSETWARLLTMEKEGALPHDFKVSDFTAILARFHSLVLKQAKKSFIVRVGTAVSFVNNLQVCHEDLDQLNESFRDKATDMLLHWRVQWERDMQVMQKELAQLAAPGMVARMASGNLADSNEALVTLAYEQQKHVDHDEIVQTLQAICYQLARAKKLTIPTSTPPWFFPFDDVDVDSEPLHMAEAQSSASMGTVHRAKWGCQTDVVVKKIQLPSPPKSSSVVTWKEADVWWKLNHPNVLRMFGACHVTSPAFIVCEFAKHGNILEYLSANPRQRSRFWRLQLDVAVGLTHLKANHVIHGNLKINNILIGDDGRAKITDFGFSYIRDSDSFVANDTVMTEDSDLGSAAVAPYAPSWPAPELRAAADRGDRMLPSYETDVYAFGICMMKLLSKENYGTQASRTLQRPPGISDDAWDLIKRMCSQDPSRRPTIHQVQRRLQRLAEEESSKEDPDIASWIGSEPSSHDVDSHRAAYQQQRRTRGGTPPNGEDMQRNRLQRELENLRQQIRNEERALERLMDKRQRAEPHATTQRAGEDSIPTTLPPSLTTKQLLRILRWGTAKEQSQALSAIDANRVEHSALEIVRNNGLDIIVASIKHGHSSEFRQLAMDILQSITTAGTGLYLDAVLGHGITQVLMGILHYRRVPIEQRRAGQFLVLLATQSARAKSFFLQHGGFDLLIKVLWQEQLPLFDKRFKDETEPCLVEDMRLYLAAHAESRTREGDGAMGPHGNLDLALQKYTEAIVLDPRNGRLYARRSAVYAAFRKYEFAEKDAQQCIRLLPQYGDGYFRHAIALFEMGQIEQADRAIRHGRKVDLQFFNGERMFELALHAPRGREKHNAKHWAAGSVEL